MKAMILAAGFGTRLWPLTEDRTKPAIPFLNRPLISYSVEYLASFGIRDIIVNLHHQPDSVRLALGDGSALGVRLRYSLEDEILGTSGAMDRVRDSLMDEDFVVMNGKIVTDIDLGAAIGKHRELGAIATLVLRENSARERFSIVEVDERGRIERFAGFPAPEAASQEAGATARGAVANNPAPPLMFTGIQVLSPRIFDYIPRDRFSHSTVDVYPKALEAGEAVVAHVDGGYWYEMSTLGRYLEASLLFSRKNGGSLVRGSDCRIEDGAEVKDSILWNRVVIERGARVNRAIIGDGVRIPEGARVEGAVVVRRDVITEMERGEVAGDNVIVPL
ncbi:MAG TPA: NDP-sugar synthase [Blastocatellia bacterium]|jgi:NDP-sugar pyrophosphorylase family protein|nr:NDP-sugar synthase [Blastocatellia bacterium]